MHLFPRSLERSLALESPVVVMSRGHSGTRILSWAIQELGVSMGATKDVPTGDTQDLRFTRGIKKVARTALLQPVTAKPRQRQANFLRRHVWRYMRALDNRAGGWGWKFPETYLIPNYIAAIFPRARYIHMVRDGRDVAFKNHLTDDQGRRLGYQLLRHIGALNLPHHAQAAMSWDFQVRRYLEFAATFPAPVHTVSFESLCRDPLAAMNEVCHFLQRPMTPECRDYLSREVDPAKIAQFRGADERELAEVEAITTPLLARLGYLNPAA